MSNDKKSVILYGNMLKAIAKLPAENCLEMMQAISAYVDGEPFDFSSPILSAWFTDIVETFKRDAEAFKATCVKRAEAGRQGGKQTQAKSSKAKQSQANASNAKQSQANQADTETGTETGTDKGGETRARDDCDDSIPTLEQVKAFAKDPTVNVSEIEAERFFYRRDGERWLDKNGRIINWRSSLRGWRCSPYYGKEAQQQSGARASPCVDEYSLTRAFEWYENHFLGDYDADPKTKEQLEQWATTNGIYERLRNRNDVLFKHVYKIK